jgi:membrane fusion protein (multidrug efflux system)
MEFDAHGYGPLGAVAENEVIDHRTVNPAKAGIQNASKGLDSGLRRNDGRMSLDSGFRRNDGRGLPDTHLRAGVPGACLVNVQELSGSCRRAGVKPAPTDPQGSTGLLWSTGNRRPGSCGRAGIKPAPTSTVVSHCRGGVYPRPLSSVGSTNSIPLGVISDRRVALHEVSPRPHKASPNQASGWNLALVVLASLLLLAGCESGHGQQAGPAPVPEVATVTVETRQVELTTELPGRTSPYLVSEIRPQVNGIIQKRQYREGSDVSAGQLLYQIDPAPFQVAHDSAKASLGKAQANLPSIRSRAERYKELLVDKAVSQQDYDDAAAAVGQAQAEIEYWKTAVEAARINLGYTRVTAPISGRIGRSSVTGGALVTAYQMTSLATIQQLDPIYVDVTQSSSELLRLKRNLETGRLTADGESGRKVRILLEDGTPYPMEGTLQFREVTVDPATGSFTLRIVVPNPEHLLLPGMFVRAVVQEGIAEQAILVPQQGVSRTPKGDPIALVVDDAGNVQQRTLTLNRAIGDQWLVSAGLSPGERIVIEGMLNVRPGAAVKAVPFCNPKDTAKAP